MFIVGMKYNVYTDAKFLRSTTFLILVTQMHNYLVGIHFSSQLPSVQYTLLTRHANRQYTLLILVTQMQYSLLALLTILK